MTKRLGSNLRWLAAARGALALTLLMSAPVFAQARIAMPILLKVLTYDQGFDDRGSGPFTVAVASEPGQASARESLTAELKGLPVTSIKNRPLKYVPIEFTNEKGLAADVERTKADAILAVPGLSPAGLHAVATVAEAAKRYSLALDVAMVETSLSVGVSTASGKPQIVINDRASRAVGARFEAAVLKLARVVK